MKAFRIGFSELRRMGRDPVNLFFLFVFPVVLILLLGASFGGSDIPKVGLIAADEGRFADEIVAALRSDASLKVEMRDDRAAMLADVERGALEAAVIVPPGYTSAIGSGRSTAVTFVAKPGDFSAAIRSTVDAAVDRQAARVRAARVAEEIGGDFQDSYATARRVEAAFPGTDVAVTTAGRSGDVTSEGRFDTGASTQLVLFTFVNSLAGSVALVQSRNYGVLRRMLAAPLSSRTILMGQTLGRFLVALMQGIFIIVAAGVLFGVNWGDPAGSMAVVALFALVSTGAAMLFGSVLKNEQQAGALVPFGLALAALGGSMVPLEVFPDTMRTIARVTPHAWANDAFEQLIAHDVGIADIAPELAVLGGFAAVSLLVGSLLLRRSLTS